MLYDGRLSIRLPVTLGPPVPEGPWGSLRSLWFDGRLHRRSASCTRSSASVLAAVYAGCREAGLTGLTVLDDAGVTLSEVRLDEPDGEGIPAAWSETPCAFELRGMLDQGDLIGELRVRFSPRQMHAGGSVVGALRMAWQPEVDDVAELASALHGRGLQTLAEVVQGRGASTLERICQALGAALEAQPHGSGSTRLVEPAERWWTLGDAARAGLEAAWVRGRQGGRWPARSADGAVGRLQGGTFVAVAEVNDVV